MKIAPVVCLLLFAACSMFEPARMTPDQYSPHGIVYNAPLFSEALCSKPERFTPRELLKVEVPGTFVVVMGDGVDGKPYYSSEYFRDPTIPYGSGDGSGELARYFKWILKEQEMLSDAEKKRHRNDMFPVGTRYVNISEQDAGYTYQVYTHKPFRSAVGYVALYSPALYKDSLPVVQQDGPSIIMRGKRRDEKIGGVK